MYPQSPFEKETGDFEGLLVHCFPSILSFPCALKVKKGTSFDWETSKISRILIPCVKEVPLRL